MWQALLSVVVGSVTGPLLYGSIPLGHHFRMGRTHKFHFFWKLCPEQKARWYKKWEEEL